MQNAHRDADGSFVSCTHPTRWTFDAGARKFMPSWAIKAWLIVFVCTLWMVGSTSTLNAQAGCTGTACVTAGTETTELSSAESALLNALLQNLTGGEINLSAANYNSLLATHIGLDPLLTQLQADLGLSGPSEVLSAGITLDQLLNAIVQVNNDAAVEAAVNGLSPAVESLGPIQLGDLLQIASDDALAGTNLNLFNLVTGTIQLYNRENVAGTPEPVTIGGDLLGIAGIGDVTLRATVVEAPLIVCGPAGTSFHSAAMRIALDITLLNVTDSGGFGLLGALQVNASISQLTLYLDIGRGQGIIETIDVLSNAVTVQAMPGIVNLYLGHIDDAIFFNRAATIEPEDVTLATIGTVELVGLSVVDIRAKSSATGGGDSELLSFDGPYPQTQSTSTGSGALNTLLTGLINNLELDVNLLGINLSGLLNFVLNLVQGLVDNVLVSILNNLLTNVMDRVLDGLGLSLGKMTVTVLGADALCPSLTVTKSHAGNFVAGGQGIYSIAVRNDGAGPTTGPITVVDTLPAGLAYSSFTGAGWSLIDQAGQVLTFAHSGPLAPGASLPTLRLTVDVAGDAAGVVTNAVSVGTPGNQANGNSSDTDETTIIEDDEGDLCADDGICPSLTVEKMHTGNFTAGAEGLYTITVRNDGSNITTGSIVVTDTLPVGMSFAALDGTGWTVISQAGQIVVFSHPGPIGPGQQLPPALLFVQVSEDASGTLVNSAVANTDGNIGNGDSETEDPTTIVPPPSCPNLPDCPSLAVEKSHSGDFTAGETGEYSILVQNDGTAATTGSIVITDTLPAGMTLNSIGGSGWELKEQIGRMYVVTHPGPLAPQGISAPLVLIVNVAESAEGTLVNRVRVDTAGNVPNDEAETEDPTTVVPPPSCPDLDECPSLSISKRHAGNFVAGGKGVYEITVTNTGTASTYSSILVTDTLPAGMSYASHSGSGWVRFAAEGQAQRFVHPGPLQPGATLPALRLTVDVDASAEGTVVNAAEVHTAGNIPTGDAEDPTTIVPPGSGDLCASQQVCPSLSISKSHTGNFVAGGQGVYAIQVHNDGAATTTGQITVVDSLPAGLTYASHSGTGWSLSAQSGQMVTLVHPGPLAPGATLPTLLLTVNISQDAAGTVINTVTAGTPGNIDDGDSDDEDSTTIVPPNGTENLCIEQGVCPALTLQKIVVGDLVAGGSGEYRFTVRNNGGGETYGQIVLTDTLPTGLTYLSHTGIGWSISTQNGQSIAMTHPGPLSPGATLPTLTVMVNIDESVEGQVVNNATVGTSGGASGAEDDTASGVVLPPTSCPDDGDCPSLSVSKQHFGNFRAGATGVYTISVQNNGSGATIGSITLEDALPEGLSFLAFSGTGWGLLEDMGETVLFVHPGPLGAGESLPDLLLTVQVSAAAEGILVNRASANTSGNVATSSQSSEDPTTIEPMPDPDILVPYIEVTTPAFTPQ